MTDFEILKAEYDKKCLHAHELEALVNRIKSICDNGARAEETVRLGVLIEIRNYRNHRSLSA